MSSDPQRAMSASEWGLLLALSVLWGGSFFFVGVAVKSLPPLTIVALRVSIAALALWTTAGLTGVSVARIRAAFPSLLVMAVLNNALPFSLLVWAQTHLPSGVAAILNAATPLLTMIAAHVLTTAEKMTVMKLMGGLLGFAGVAAMIGLDASSGLGGNVLAELACVAAAAFYALASIFGRRFRAMREIKPIDVATGQLTGSSLVLLPLAGLFDMPWRLPFPPLTTVAALLAFGCFSTALAYAVYFRILAGAGATNVVLVTVLAPATTILLGAIGLGEHLAARDFFGLALIAMGLAFVDGRLPRRAANWLFGGPTAGKARV